ncbi:pilus assembly protein TadG-related protein [Nesterenkonia sp.]|uniref:pilus assembly protein TadG-related protein n=1 Tax=Nesterenkonia sp. TaxID=704201 RepID=UPI0026272AE3|nr:pilus assembly protein TadG-related protein [Nesterenkonia sp.]
MKRLVRKDDGQVSLAVVLLGLAVLLMGIGLMVLGQASDARGKAQKAADAAALGAADSVRQQWIQAWVNGQRPPSDPGDPVRVLPFGFFGEAASLYGYDSAVGYARANSNSRVADYSVLVPEPGAIRVSVETVSEQTEVVGTGDRLVGAPRGSASAVAEVRLRPGVHCRGSAEWDGEDEEELESWTVRCTGAGFGAVRVIYRAGGHGGVSYDPSEIGRLFEIRLTS